MADTDKDCRPDAEPGSGVNVDGCRAGDITMPSRGVCRQVLKLRGAREGSLGEAAGANWTREIRLSGMRGGLAETWVMGVGLRPTGKPVDKPPNPKAARRTSTRLVYTRILLSFCARRSDQIGI